MPISYLSKPAHQLIDTPHSCITCRLRLKANGNHEGMEHLSMESLLSPPVGWYVYKRFCLLLNAFKAIVLANEIYF